MSFVAALAALAVIGSPQQASSAPSQESRVDDIEVIGGRALRDAVEAFADTVVAPPVGRSPARWHRRICVGAVNLQRDAAQGLIDRVSEVARSLGVESMEPGCKPSILIVGTDDGRAMASALVDFRPYAFRPNYAGATRSRLQLARFTETEAPVRWWHVALPVIADTGDIAVTLRGEAPRQVPGGSRLRTEIRNDLSRAFVIIDFNKASSVSFDQLADYVAMAVLAQLDPDADMSAYPTVLNIFSEGGGPVGLTDWDRAYLTGLYGAETNRREPSHAISEIGHHMARDLSTPPEQQAD